MIYVIIDKSLNDLVLRNFVSEVFQVSNDEVSGLDEILESKIKIEIDKLTGEFVMSISIYFDEQEFSINDHYFGKLISEKFKLRSLISDNSILPDRYILFDSNEEKYVLINTIFDETDSVFIKNIEGSPPRFP